MPEKILGILGGSIGILVALYVLLMGGIGVIFEAPIAFKLIGLGVATILLFIIGIIGGRKVEENIKMGGILMLISGIFGTSVEIFMISIVHDVFSLTGKILWLATAFLVSGGILALTKKNSKEEE